MIAIVDIDDAIRVDTANNVNKWKFIGYSNKRSMKFFLQMVYKIAILKME